jgi:hypothetical protein
MSGREERKNECGAKAENECGVLQTSREPFNGYRARMMRSLAKDRVVLFDQLIQRGCPASSSRCYSYVMLDSGRALHRTQLDARGRNVSCFVYFVSYFVACRRRRALVALVCLVPPSALKAHTWRRAWTLARHWLSSSV